MTSARRAAGNAVASATLSSLVALAAACGSATAAGPAGRGSGAALPAAPHHTAAAPGVAPCATRDLAARISVSGGTAGHVYTVLGFTNTGTAACTLYGYPGVSFAAGTPARQIGAAAAHNKTPPPVLVTLKPGQAGNALLRIAAAGSFPASVCAPVTTAWLRIFPPGQKTPIYLRDSIRTCSRPVQTLTVNVIEPGPGNPA